MTAFFSSYSQEPPLHLKVEISFFLSRTRRALRRSNDEIIQEESKNVRVKDGCVCLVGGLHACTAYYSIKDKLIVQETVQLVSSLSKVIKQLLICVNNTF